ncbi:4-vinyl reductase [Levilinea saccharolytica]|nr:V4R domain-containing protein [Levilinea saccharolytica]GAP17131.1 protein containing V4R domain [Levilinea saccharolytica]
MSRDACTSGCLQPVGRMVLDGVQEIVGRVGLVAVLNLANLSHLSDPAAALKGTDLRALRRALEDLYGRRGGRGVLLRSGRAAFRPFLDHFGEELHLTQTEFRLQPAPVRIQAGLEAITGVLSQVGSSPLDFTETPDAWVWTQRGCWWCHPSESQEPVCQFAVGLLQEYLNWASGKVYHVEETACKGTGAEACVFHISKHPLD